MRKTIARAAVLAVTATSLSVAFVTPALAEPAGLRCRFSSITDPTVEGDVQVGQINAGPITGGGEVGDVQITCTIQVNIATHGGGGASVSSEVTPGAAVIPPSQISYVSPEGSIVYMCTKVTVGGQAYYWNSTGGGPSVLETGSWSTSSGGPCSTAISQEIETPALPIEAVVIIAPPDGSEPIHTNIDGADCSSYTWNPITGEYDVTCVAARVCSPVTVAAIGAPGAVTGMTWCTGGPVAVAVSPGVAVAGPGGVYPWHCVGIFRGPGIVVCTED